MYEPTLRTVRSIADAVGATVLDPTPIYCPDESCTYALNGVSVYRDTTHLTAAGARMMLPLLRQVLEPTKL